MKKVLLVTDDVRYFSGVGNQARHICKKLCNSGYDVSVIGVLQHKGQVPPPTEHKFDTGERITIYPHTRYDDMGLIANIIDTEKIDCLVLFQDPRFYGQLWTNAVALKSKCLIVYVHGWDTWLTNKDTKTAKAHWNLPIYQSVNSILTISHQTTWFLNEVLKKDVYGDKPPIEYVGHGQDPNVYRPLQPADYAKIKANLFGPKDGQFKFVAIAAGRNQTRKKLPDTIMAWDKFTDSITNPNECALILKTEPTCNPDNAVGTNLVEVCAALAPNKNIYLVPQSYPEETMNQLYNMADVNINAGNAGSFELTCNEAMLAGTPVIANAQSGLLDQIGFFENGLPVNFSPEMKGRLKELEHGKWAYPLIPNPTIIGHPFTPYLFEENAPIEQIVNGLLYWYFKTPEEREACGLLGRQWAIDRGLTCNSFAAAVVHNIGKALENHKKPNTFRVYKV